MKTKVPEDVKDAFEVLAMNHEFKKILEWLEESLNETRIANDSLEGISLTRSQGSATVLNKIVQTAKGS